MALTLSHGGPTMYRSAAPSKQVLVGTIQGVVCIERDAAGDQHRTPALERIAGSFVKMDAAVARNAGH